MIHLYHDAEYVFRFADCRRITRFHLDGAPAGARVTVFRIDAITGGRLGLLTVGVTDDAGWVAVAEPIIVKAGEAFVAVPDDVEEPTRDDSEIIRS